MLALRDVQQFEGALKTCVTVPLAQHEYDAYVSFAYNVGPRAFCQSTLVKKLNTQDYPGACQELLRWRFFQGKDCALPADVPGAVADMLPYFQTEGMTAPALEFLSPIKGPALEQITVEVGSGIRPAAEATALYDQDVEKQAKQLGLPTW